MTKLGATGATAGALMAPLDIVMMPLLKKSGQLGQTGDLILEIDDQRVTDQADGFYRLKQRRREPGS